MNSKKYLVLAVLGALIIGVSCYLFLNSYMDRAEIIVLSRDIKQGEIISEYDLGMKQYYKNELPDSYIANKSEAVGQKIFMDRKKDDFISKDMFIQEEEKMVIHNLQKGEVLIALNVKSRDPLLQHLNAGQRISIVSTNRDTSFMEADIHNYPENGLHEKILIPDNYVDRNTFSLSERILYIDGYLVIRDLKIMDLKIIDSSNQNILIGTGENESVYIYLKCSIEEAPYISSLARNENYKIILEGTG